MAMHSNYHFKLVKSDSFTIYGLTVPKNSIIVFENVNTCTFIHVFKNLPRNYKGKTPFLRFETWDGCMWSENVEHSDLTARVYKVWSSIDKPRAQKKKASVSVQSLMKRGESASGRDHGQYAFWGIDRTQSVKPMDGHIVTEVINGHEITTADDSRYDTCVTNLCYETKGTCTPQVSHKPLKPDKGDNTRYDNTVVSSHVYSGNEIVHRNPDAERLNESVEKSHPHPWYYHDEWLKQDDTVQSVPSLETLRHYTVKKKGESNHDIIKQNN